MANRTIRKIITIDEEKCNGCGVCIPNCVEGALQIIDGKAKLIHDKYCDGLGACLGHCPQDAITIEDRESEPFDEVATEEHMKRIGKSEPAPSGGCPSAAIRQFEQPQAADQAPAEPQASALGHWPVQLALVPATAPFLQGAELVLSGDCVPFAYPEFHKDFIRGKALLVACPKLDDFTTHQLKLTEILKRNEIKRITVIHMEVPCCSGLVYMATQAIKASGKDVPVTEVTISVKGQEKQRSAIPAGIGS